MISRNKQFEKKKFEYNRGNNKHHMKNTNKVVHIFKCRAFGYYSVDICNV